MFLSIHLNSNNPKNILELVENINTTAANPKKIEIIVNIDDGDEASLNNIKNLQKKDGVVIKYIQTNIIKSFKDVWKPYNKLLLLTDKDVDFVTLFSDEFRFSTPEWDNALKKYIGYYDDNIFRIRLSRYRYYNYKDFWQCVFAPDSLAFYTKRWMDVVGQWCPCTGPDSWQQTVSFYLTNSREFDHIQYNRDVVDPFISFMGEGASQGLEGDVLRRRIKDNVDLWFDTVSHKMQEEACKAAAKLQAAIIMHENKNIKNKLVANQKPPIFQEKKLEEVSFQDNETKKQIEFYCNKKLIYKISYKICKIRLFLLNNFRKTNYAYYAGGGKESFISNFIDQLIVYRRIRKYGIFGNVEPISLKIRKIFTLKK